MAYALGFIHGIDFLLSTWLIGSLVFRSVTLKAGGEAALGLVAHWPNKIATLIGFTFMSSLVWMLFTAGDMAESWQPGDLWMAMSQTRFGHVWCLRLALLILMFAWLRFAVKSQARIPGLMALALLLPLPSALTGHAGASEARMIFHIGVDWSHSIAVAVWTGGLWALQNWLSRRLVTGAFGTDTGIRVVKRFSKFAVVSTFVIGGTGFLMAYSAGVSFWSPWSTDYGRLVIGKLLFFMMALSAAALNHFHHLRNWSIENDKASTNAIRREVRTELALIVVLFGLAGFLARTSPPSG